MTSKFSLKAVTATALLLVATSAFAADEYNVSSGLTGSGAPLAFHGVDPVAFVTLGNRIDGSAAFAADHDGTAYYFATEDNRDAFMADPDAYLPQNGGFCTLGVALGKKLDGDPKYSAVIEGKLYVFLNEQVFRTFQKDIAGTIATAEEIWPTIRSTPTAEL